MGLDWAGDCRTAECNNFVSGVQNYVFFFSFFFLNGEGVEKKGRRVDEKGQEWGGPGMPRVAGLPRIDRPQFLSSAA